MRVLGIVTAHAVPLLRLGLILDNVQVCHLLDRWLRGGSGERHRGAHRGGGGRGIERELGVDGLELLGRDDICVEQELELLDRGISNAAGSLL